MHVTAADMTKGTAFEAHSDDDETTFLRSEATNDLALHPRPTIERTTGTNETETGPAYRLRWHAPEEHIELVNGEWAPTGADEATVVLETAQSTEKSEGEWTPVEDGREPSETLVVESEDESEDESLWRAAEDRLLARFGMGRSDITEVLVP